MTPAKTGLRAILFISLALLAGSPTLRSKEKAVHRTPLPDQSIIDELPANGGPEFNRLVFETSPYLRQHARNPVDWYPWGPEALKKAKAEDKPIFLSVGYSACHWCHVMEHESFEDDDVAALLNAHFINVKVDREERPDIDQIYMAATQIMTGRGGWPNSVFMRPDGSPFFAGTYFPKEDRAGRPGFITLLKQLNRLWDEDRPRIDDAAERLAEGLRQVARHDAPLAHAAALDRTTVDAVIVALNESFDKQHAGFGGAPKFPPHRELTLLVEEFAHQPQPQVETMVRQTLDTMALGGMHDHIGGGFHRYSTDATWFLPHFEKMLYDNAQLGRIYARAAVVFQEPRYADIARRLFDWCIADLRHADGGFYSAYDADSEGEEGVFYLWKHQEVIDLLGETEGAAFATAYDITPKGNYYEEATGHRTDDNIPHLSEWPTPEDAIRWAALRKKLEDTRSKRVPPQLDDKVLASWNGLMIGALAIAGRDLEEPRYLRAAEETAGFVLRAMEKDGRLLRTWREGRAAISAYLEDYAYLADGLLDLYEVTQDTRWRDRAAALTETVDAHFADPKAGGYFFTADDAEALLTRNKEAYDNATPSPNGIMARVLARLAITATDADEKARYAQEAQTVIEAFRGVIEEAPRAAVSLVHATALLVDHDLITAEEAPAAAAISYDGESDGSGRARPVQADAFFASDLVAPGEALRFAVRLRIDPSWHLYTDQPGADYFIPTTINAKHAAVDKVDVTFPKGKPFKTEGIDDVAMVYEKEVWLFGKVHIKANAPSARIDLPLTISFQACDDATCLQPASIQIDWPLGVAPDAADAEVMHAELWEK